MNNDIPLSGQIAELAESLKRSETLPHIEQNHYVVITLESQIDTVSDDTK